MPHFYWRRGAAVQESEARTGGGNQMRYGRALTAFCMIRAAMRASACSPMAWGLDLSRMAESDGPRERDWT